MRNSKVEVILTNCYLKSLYPKKKHQNTGKSIWDSTLFCAKKFKYLLGRTRLQMLFRQNQDRGLLVRKSRIFWVQSFNSNSKLSHESNYKTPSSDKISNAKAKLSSRWVTCRIAMLNPSKRSFFALYSGNLRCLIVKFKRVRNGMKISHSLDLRIS